MKALFCRCFYFLQKFLVAFNCLFFLTTLYFFVFCGKWIECCVCYNFCSTKKETPAFKYNAKKEECILHMKMQWEMLVTTPVWEKNCRLSSARNSYDTILPSSRVNFDIMYSTVQRSAICLIISIHQIIKHSELIQFPICWCLILHH